MLAEPVSDGRGWHLCLFRRTQCRGAAEPDRDAPAFRADPQDPQSLAGAALEIGRLVRSIENPNICQWNAGASGVGKKGEPAAAKLLRYAAIYALYRHAPLLYEALLREARLWFHLEPHERPGRFHALAHLPLCRIHPLGPAAYGCMFQGSVAETLHAFASERDPSGFAFRAHVAALAAEEEA